MTFDSNIEDIVCVSDILGNTSGYYVKINNIDSQAPQISVQCPTADWTTQKFQVAVALSDDQLLKSYRLDSGTEIALSGKEQTVLIDCDKLAGKTITVTDSVGRQNSYKFDKLFYDPDFPQITDVRISDTEWTSEAVTIGVAANDGISGLADEAYSFDGGASWQKSNSYAFEQNTQGIVIAVRDKAGNTSYYYKDENGRACYTDNVDDAAVINISNIDKTVPNTPAVCAENGTVNIFGTGAEFDEATESPERFEYKIGENGEWVKYEEPFELVNTADVTVYARAADEAGRMSEASAFTAESTLGEYTASYDDIALGEGVLPVGFFRTYSSKPAGSSALRQTFRQFLSLTAQRTLIIMYSPTFTAKSSISSKMPRTSLFLFRVMSLK